MPASSASGLRRRRFLDLNEADERAVVADGLRDRQPLHWSSLSHDALFRIVGKRLVLGALGAERVEHGVVAFVALVRQQTESGGRRERKRNLPGPCVGLR